MIERTVKIVEPDKGRHMAIANDINTILATKDDTEGTYSILEIKVFPNGGPLPHIQTREHEGFYIIEGQIVFNVNGKRIEANPGTFVNVPPGILHSFKNEQDKVAKIIVVLSPPGLEQLFVEAGIEISDNNVKPPSFDEKQKQKLVNIFPKYGVKLQ
jgi:mannose-6-phosphate isomerase-like protein (cupin superfamily)